MPGGVNHSAARKVLEEEPFTVLLSKLQKGFLIPFLSLLFLSHAPHSLQYSIPRLFLNIHGVLMPPAAGCWLLARCKIHTLPWLLASPILRVFCLHIVRSVLALSSVILCFSLTLSKCLALFPHHFSVPLVSDSLHPCFSIFTPLSFSKLQFLIVFFLTQPRSQSLS